MPDRISDEQISMEKSIFRENLIMLCDARRLTGAEASRLSGVDYQVVQNLLARRQNEPKLSDAIALARLFGMSVEEMMASAAHPAPYVAAETHYRHVLDLVCNLDHDERGRLLNDLRARGEQTGSVRIPTAQELRRSEERVSEEAFS
jgi:transcriptional regulator with XRE-family HTH domain